LPAGNSVRASRFLVELTKKVIDQVLFHAQNSGAAGNWIKRHLETPGSSSTQRKAIHFEL